MNYKLSYQIKALPLQANKNREVYAQVPKQIDCILNDGDD